MSLIKNGFYGTLINRRDSKSERKSGQLSVMSGCFIENNFGPTTHNISLLKRSPIMLKKSHMGVELPFTNQVQRPTPFLEASVCIFAPAAVLSLGRTGWAACLERAGCVS